MEKSSQSGPAKYGLTRTQMKSETGYRYPHCRWETHIRTYNLERSEEERWVAAGSSSGTQRRMGCMARREAGDPGWPAAIGEASLCLDQTRFGLANREIINRPYCFFFFAVRGGGGGRRRRGSKCVGLEPSREAWGRCRSPFRLY
jgi:hypothetical protein